MTELNSSFLHRWNAPFHLQLVITGLLSLMGTVAHFSRWSYLPLLLPYKDVCFLVLCSVLFTEKRLTYLLTFSLFDFQICIDACVIHPYGLVLSESIYIILVRGGGDRRKD